MKCVCGDSVWSWAKSMEPSVMALYTFVASIATKGKSAVPSPSSVPVTGAPLMRNLVGSKSARACTNFPSSAGVIFQLPKEIKICGCWSGEVYCIMGNTELPLIAVFYCCERSTSMSAPQKTEREFQSNLCIQLSGFDLDAPNGGYANGVVVAPAHRMGEEVSIRMMTQEEALAGFRQKYDEKANKKFFKNAPTIEGWAKGFNVGANTIPPMEVGGYMQFTGCTRDAQASVDGVNVYKAQYSENYGNDLGRGVIHGMGRYVERNGFAALEVMRVDEAQVIKSVDDLRNFYAEHMVAELPDQPVQREPLAVLRIATLEGPYKGATKACMLYVPKDKNADYTPFSAEQAFTDAFVEGKQAKGLASIVAAALDDDLMQALPEDFRRDAQYLKNDLNSGKKAIEMIAGDRFPVVGTTLESLQKEGSKMNRYVQKGILKAESGDTYPGFVAMTVATAYGVEPDNGGKANIILSKFANDEWALPWTMGNMPTSHVASKFVQERMAAVESLAESAAQANINEVAAETPDMDGFFEQQEVVLEQDAGVGYDPMS